MSKAKKYNTQIEQIDSQWRAQITRQVTSKKIVVTKQKDDFKSESVAKAWAKKELSKFTKTLVDSNTRHGEQRKESEEIQRLRSSRRAEKSQLAKDEKAKEVEADSGPAQEQQGDVNE